MNAESLPALHWWLRSFPEHWWRILQSDHCRRPHHSHSTAPWPSERGHCHTVWLPPLWRVASGGWASSGCAGHMGGREGIHLPHNHITISSWVGLTNTFCELWSTFYNILYCDYMYLRKLGIYHKWVKGALIADYSDFGISNCSVFVNR